VTDGESGEQVEYKLESAT